MLAPTKPETLKTLEEIKRLEFLRDVIIPEAKADPNTNLDFTHHPCGTPSCLLGRAYAHKLLNESAYGDVGRAATELGISIPESKKIFGFPHANSIDGPEWFAGTLEQRAQVITKIIERKYAEIAE